MFIDVWNLLYERSDFFIKLCLEHLMISAIAIVTFGAEYDFYEREDGYTPLCDAYGLNF